MPLTAGNVAAAVDTPRRTILLEALAAPLLVTLLVTGISMVLPAKAVATAVGLTFLGATAFLVWRHDDARVERAGLALGGLVLPGRLDVRRLARGWATSLGWALLLSAFVFVPFFFGWRVWWKAHGTFSLPLTPKALSDMGGELLGQLVIIALPEEAFYRGYLQSRLDDLWSPTARILGARVGPSILVTSAIFALGHLATIHDAARLAVFFPSLLFGWLRARTGGIGAACLFHAFCNMFTELLGRGYGVY